MTLASSLLYGLKFDAIVGQKHVARDFKPLPLYSTVRKAVHVVIKNPVPQPQGHPYFVTKEMINKMKAHSKIMHKQK